jgi:4-hydroxy-2-oxoheptanedioate aldolase
MNSNSGSFREKFEAGTQYGVWHAIPDTNVAEILAGAGFDWILIDAEHAPFDISTIHLHLQVLAACDAHVIVRPPSKDPVMLMKLLDSGVKTLIVPMVETAEEAAELFSSMQFPPLGKRGIGTPMTRAGKWMTSGFDYDVENRQVCLIAQVETAKGLKNFDAILETNGVDGIFIGPMDLSASLGYTGQTDHPEVQKAIREVIAKTRTANKIAGIFALSEKLINLYLGYGANMVGIGVDTVMLSESARKITEKYKKG